MPILYDTFGTYWFIHRSIVTSPYIILATLAAAIGIIMAFFEMKRRRFGSEARRTVISSIIIYILLIIFARLFYFLGPWSWKQYPDLSSRILAMFSFEAGMVFYGGMIGGILGLFIYAKIKKINFWEFADIWAPSLGIILFFARIGCYTAGCCYGIESHAHLPWLILRDNAVIHPTQLYSSLLGLLVFVAMTELKYRQKIKGRFNGYVFLWGIILYSAGRFFIEFLRYYELKFLGLSSSQLISIGLFVACSAILFLKHKNHKTGNKKLKPPKYL